MLQFTELRSAGRDLATEQQLFIAVSGLLSVVASLAAEHRL